MDTDSYIHVEHTAKRFGDVTAVADISFRAARGEIFGLIGPDGGGKTTLLRCIATLMKPDSGRIRVGGMDSVADFRKIRTVTGYMPGTFSLYSDLSVDENLSFFASIFGTRVRENYTRIRPIYAQLEPFRNRRASALSGGMKQKLALCCALVHKPDLLILDEPTTGVDAVSRKEFWDILNNLTQAGMTILVSTPYMDEANRCDRIGLMQKGRFLAVDTPAHVINNFQYRLYVCRGPRLFSMYKHLKGMQEQADVHLFGQELHVYAHSPGVTQEYIQDRLIQGRFHEAEVSIEHAGIEDCFISLMEAPDHDE